MKTLLLIFVICFTTTFASAQSDGIDWRSTALSNVMMDYNQTSRFDGHLIGYQYSPQGRIPVYKGVTEGSKLWNKFKDNTSLTIGFTAYTIGVDALIQKAKPKDRPFLYAAWSIIHASAIMHNNRIGVSGFPIISFHKSW